MRGLSLALAKGNVQKNVRSYSVYFATLAFCACLLYTYASCTDTIAAIGDGTAAAQGLSTMRDAAQLIAPLGFFSVLVFCFLASYAARFIARRRKKELALLELFGMRKHQVARVLRLECGIVGLAAAGAGIAAGIALSPLTSVLAAWSFHLAWRPALVISLPGVALCLGGFLMVALISAIASVRELRRSSIHELLSAEHVSDAAVKPERGKLVRELAIGLACVALGYGICLSLVGFILFMVPMIALVVCGSCLVVHAAAGLLGDLFRRSRGAWKGVRLFVVRELEAHVSASSKMLAVSSALLAVGTCAIAMAAGIRGQMTEEILADAEATALLGSFIYIILFFGLTFLISALAVLALHQMAEGLDEKQSFAKLEELGATEGQLKGALRAETGAFFLTSFAMAVVHVSVGFIVAEALLVNLFALPGGSVSYPAVLAGVSVSFLAYLAISLHAVTQNVLGERDEIHSPRLAAA